MRLKLYTSPFCSLCGRLKEALVRMNLSFEELDVSDTEVMADLIMRDIYLTSTPALEVEGRILTSKELLPNGEVDLNLLKEILEESGFGK